MTTEELAKLIAERVISYADYIECVVPIGCLGTLIASAIRDLNLIQAEPIPEGAVPVVVYCGLRVNEIGEIYSAVESADSVRNEDEATDWAFREKDTHRVRLEGYALPVGVPTVQAVSKPV